MIEDSCPTYWLQIDLSSPSRGGVQTLVGQFGLKQDHGKRFQEGGH